MKDLLTIYCKETNLSYQFKCKLKANHIIVKSNVIDFISRLNGINYIIKVNGIQFMKGTIECK